MMPKHTERRAMWMVKLLPIAAQNSPLFESMNYHRCGVADMAQGLGSILWAAPLSVWMKLYLSTHMRLLISGKKSI